MALTFNNSYLKGFMSDHEIDALAPFIKTSHDMLSCLSCYISPLFRQ